MRIDNKNTFEHALSSGINLFLGAGFSILAKDANGHYLPTGTALAKELAVRFSKPGFYSLPQLSTIIENSTSKQDFYDFLINRFSVKSVDPLYYNLLNVNIKNISTTNIDDLIFCIYNDSVEHFINDQFIDGVTTDPRGINYLPLHGSVIHPDSRFVFDVGSLASIYNDAPRIWRILANQIETHPTLFLGYGFNDNSVLQTLLSQQTFNNAKKDMWVLLREEDEQYSEYYQSLGFNVIMSNIKGFLEYLSTIIQPLHTGSDIERERLEILKPYMIPKNLRDVRVQRPIKDFYGGSSPKWSDILSGQLYKTHFISLIVNSIHNPNKNTIIIGAPVTGKTTSMMIAAKECQMNGLALYFDSLTAPRAEYVLKLIGKDKAVIFVDNLYDSMEGIKILEVPNIKIVASERSHNYYIISHLLDEDKYEIINVTTLSDNDLQGVFNSLPASIRGTHLVKETNLDVYGHDSLFEFVIRNVSLQNIKERYKVALQNLENNDSDLAEFLVLCAYMHKCHVPLSIENAYDYFDGKFEFDDIFSLRDDADGIVKDYIPVNDIAYENMDYYYPRLLYIAEVILDSCSSKLLSKVLNGVLQNVSPIRICNYKTFRKYAFDKNITLKAFENWKDGKSYYENAFVYDKSNPYVLQQGALFLSQKKQYANAFAWIDKAMSMTDDKYFSIRNSHAVILFSANINKEDDSVRSQLDKSMDILEKCMTADARKRFHAYTYARQAIKYHTRFFDEKSAHYLKTARHWLQNVLSKNSWDDESRALLKEVDVAISQLG